MYILEPVTQRRYIKQPDKSEIPDSKVVNGLRDVQLRTLFNEMIHQNDKNTTIIISGASNYIKELNLNTGCETKFLEDF